MGLFPNYLRKYLETMFKKYKDCKKQLANKQLDLGFQKDIDLPRILAFDLIRICYNQYDLKVKHLFKLFLRYNLPKLPKGDLLISMGEYGQRKDYKEIYNYVLSQLDKSSAQIQEIDLNQLKLKVFLSLSNLYWSFKLTKDLELGFQGKIALYINICFQLNNLKALEKVDYDFNKYLAFSSVHFTEAMFTSYFKTRGLKTFSLQHGLYELFHNKIPIDAILYENLISHKHLTWGNYTKDEFLKYGINPERIEVGGYPRFCYHNLKFRELGKGGDILVFLSRKQFHNANLEALTVLAEVKNIHPEYNFHLKLHPSLNTSEYSAIAKETSMKLLDVSSSISDLISSMKYDISVSINTSAYYESYLLSIPGIRFKHKSYEVNDGINNWDVFSNVDDFLEIMNQLRKELKQNNFGYKIEQRLEYILGRGINNYKQLLGSV